MSKMALVYNINVSICSSHNFHNRSLDIHISYKRPSPHLMMNQMHFCLLTQILLWQQEGLTVGWENP